MRFRKTNSTLINLEHTKDVTLYDVLGLFKDICDDLEDADDIMLDEMALGDAEKAVGRLLWIGQEITSVLRSNKKMITEPNRAEKLRKQEEKLASETAILQETEAELIQYIQQEKQLKKIQEKKIIADQEKRRLREICEQIEAENRINESTTIPELQERKTALEEQKKELHYTKRTCEEEIIKLKISNEELMDKVSKVKMEEEEVSALYESLHAKLKELENNKYNYQKKNQEIKGEMAMLEQECHRLEYDNIQLASVTIPELEKEKESISGQIEELKQELESKQKEKDLRYERVQSLKKSVDELLQQNIYLAQVIKDTQQQVEGFEAIKKEKQTDIDLLEAQLKKQEEQLGDLTSEKNTLIRKITELTANIDEHNIHNLRKRFDEQQAEYQKLEMHCQDLQKQYDEMLRGKDGKELEKETLEQSIIESGRILTEIGEDIHRLEEEKATVLKTLEEKKTQKQGLEEWFLGLECKDCTERIKRIQNRIYMLKDVQESLIRDLDARLYLSNMSATEQVKRVSEDIYKRLMDYEDGVRGLQSEYATIVKMIYDKGE